MLIAGVDEAGRGCAIGPLVIAGVLIKEENIGILSRLGIKDSKLLSPRKRETLVVEIEKIMENRFIIKLTPQEIDRAVERKTRFHKLNRLEAQTMAKIIEALKPDEAFVDAADVFEDRFKRHIQEKLTFRPRITSKHKADKIYPVVSAASIVAKVERDKEVALLRAEFGDFGSGYLTDPKTMKFLRGWLERNDEYPDCVRNSWKPVRKAKDERGSIQKKLC